MIMFLDFIIGMMIVFIIAFLYTQVLIPLYKGTPLFPVLFVQTPVSAQIEEAEHTLEELAELEVLQERIAEINRRKANLEGK